LADVDTPVIISGEDGTGRAYVARTIHNMSIRKDGPFRIIECGSLPPIFLESELFGHLKEAVPGAVRDKIGQFELAHKGTVYLANPESMPVDLQEKFLEFLESGYFNKVGGSRSIRADVRIIAGASELLPKLVQEGKFKKDLFELLKVIEIEIPPLQNRRQDIELLVAHFLKESQNSSVASRQPKNISASAMRALIRYDWPGNIRELQDALEFAFSVCSGNTINLNDLPPEIMRTLLPQEESSEEDEVTRILRALEESHWRRNEAAQILGMDRSTLWRKMKAYGLA
jgi:DNA-binding NtrC family response regulator